jgi:superfamily I DNA/RNA helicase
MIKGFNDNEIGNPIRAHINISFEKVGDREDMLKSIVKELSNNFDVSKSAALIFVQTRKGTEEACLELNKLFEENKLDCHNKIEYYHAGLDSVEREEKYLNYKNGKTVILVATKAFGMGMDIKNIHYIFHLGPSSTFEDYLQEVGRAGRNPEMLLKAGFSENNPIKTKCLFTPQDFSGLRDKSHKNQITWMHLNQVRKTVLDYIEKFKPLIENDENAFPLPLNLLDGVTDFKERFDRDTFFRICLYWLEKLNRFKLGVFTPTHLPIKILLEEHNFRSIRKEEDKSKLVNFHATLINLKKNNFEESDTVMISLQELKDLSGETNTTELFSLLFKAQKAKLIVIERDLFLEPTQLRMPELKNKSSKTFFPIIEATFSFSNELLKKMTLGGQKSFDGEELQNVITPIIHEIFVPRNFNWKQPKNTIGNDFYTSEELAKRIENEFIKKRAKFAFKALGFVPKIKHKTIINLEKGYEKPTVTQLLFNGNKSVESQLLYLNNYKNDLYKLINIITNNYVVKNKGNYNIIDLMVDLDIDDKGEEYLQRLIFIAKGLGYLKGEGSLIPMGIELYTKDISDFQDETIGSNDFLIKEEFIDTGKMKELRLLALECLSERPYQEQDKFIKQFFKCGNIKELLSLLEEYFSENNPVLAAYRQEALEKEKKKLNPQQEKVFNAPLNKNIQVIAGPGSGKTHTLILRIARLIQEEKVNPETILVLAYNRAVVIELKERLTKLFKDLGYAKLINRLKVFTFHGFAKYCLGEQIDNLDFEEWTPAFIKTMNETPGLINQKLGVLKYVFVDEFQDITKERLQLLQFIANPKNTKICVIGDPNQSIYGYQRDQTGDPMEPKPYYEDFKKIYKAALELNLAINYRSFPDILIEAEKLLSLNETSFEMPKLEAFLKPDTDNKYCELSDLTETRINWKDKVIEFVNYKNANNEKYKQIAVMFRSNDEVFRAFNILKNEKLENIRIRIQGAKGSLFKTREFHHFLSYFKSKIQEQLTANYIDDFQAYKQETEKHYPNWENYFLDILHCIIIEFDKEKEVGATFSDLINFIKEISYKDDGQYEKIYQQNINKIKSNYIDQEIVLTTMHKVKGIEYDAVIIPASLSNLPSTEVPENKIKDYIEEERRLYYVAYTRAKKRLFIIKHSREKALEKGISHQYSESTIRTNYGLKIKEGIDKFTMYWSASKYDGNSFEYIKNNVKIGDEIYLNKVESTYTFWYVIHNNQKIAQLSRAMSTKLVGLSELNGFVVSSVYVNTHEETVLSDEKNGTQYAINWTPAAKERGYIYLIDFSGFGK